MKQTEQHCSKYLQVLQFFVSVFELAFELVIATLGHLNLKLDNYNSNGSFLWWGIWLFSYSLMLFVMYSAYKQKFILTIAIVRVIKMIGVIIVSTFYFHYIGTLDIQDWINRLRDVFKYLVNENDNSDQQANDV